MRFRWLTVPFVLTVVAGCRGAEPNHPQAAVGAGVERDREVASPRSCIGRQRILEALGQKESTAASPVGREKYKTDPLSNALSPAESYRVGAPATVIIRTRDGLGSGVVVDKSGLVLTNHHVVDDFLQPDLTMRVSLELANIEPTGRMKRTGKTYQGVVLKADAVKDLALIRMIDPPANLAAIPLSNADPQVGENVLSIGHAGIGLTWAAKSCTVSGVGDQTRDTSMLEVGDCSLKDPSDTEKEAKRRTDQCEARKREIKEELATATQGLAVQTSCNITHGDSGGPLLNAHGEIVGLNQSLRFDAATVAFHVHVAEIRAFLKDVPAKPLQIEPDPWCEGGTEASVEDLDGDGKPDTVKLVGGFGRRFGMGGSEATFIDLDGDDGKSARSRERPFEAEVIVLHKGDDVFAWYDTDNDGKFDVLVRDKESDGSIDVAWKLVNGRFEPDATVKGKKTIDVAFLRDEASKSRLGSVAQAMGWAKIASAETMAVAESFTVPDPFTGAIQHANAGSMEGPNDKPMMVHAFGPGGDRLYIDTRSEALSALKSGDDARALIEQRKLKPELVSLGRPNGRWALYDTDGDGKLDLALFAKNPIDKDEFGGRGGSYVTDAFDITGPKPKRVTDHVGRSVVRPRLFKSEKTRKAATMMAMGANDDGRSTFPKPYGSGFARVPWRFAEGDEKPLRTLERLDKNTAVAMLDLDGDTKDLATKAPEDFVRQQSFDFEVAFIRTGRLAWAYYDTDNDGAFDLVLFTKDVDKGTVDAAFTLNKSGEKVDRVEAKGAILQPERVGKSPKAIEAIKKAYARVADRKEEKEEK
ncbi:MAG: trypsin-like peptidase domain-containing protein [Deltaproteobacteria bacterium]|nr:trypsin-like peptidase domain-containing protein [Deltaproteobacteria bacterium]